MKFASIPMIAFLFLVGCTAGPVEERSLEDLLGTEASVSKLAGGMGFTEGPVWLPKEETLVFSDIPNAKLMKWSESGGLQVFRESPNPNGNLLDREGRLLTCRHGARDVVRTERDGTLTILCDSFEGKRLNSPNDVAVHSDGSLWFTDPPWGLVGGREGKEQLGNYVFRLDPDSKEVTLLLEDVSMPNGIAFSPDERHLYVVDTGGRWHPEESSRELPATIAKYQVQENGTLNLEPAWKVEAFCDGMSVDVLGNLYTTTPEGIAVLSPNGDLIGTIEVPESPTNCCFGGDEFKTLFITARTSLYSVQLANSGHFVRQGKKK